MFSNLSKLGLVLTLISSSCFSSISATPVVLPGYSSLEEEVQSFRKLLARVSSSNTNTTNSTVSGSSNTTQFLNSTAEVLESLYPDSPGLPSIKNQTSSWITQDEGDNYDVDEWLVYTTTLRNNSFSIQPYVANGYIGIRIPVQGQGFAIDRNQSDPESDIQPKNGWPLYNQRFTGAYIAGFWDYQTEIPATNFPELLKKGGESVISTLPVWSVLDITDKKSNKSYTANLTDTDEISNWSQSLSLKHGIVQTNLTWTPSGSSSSSNSTSSFNSTSSNSSIPSYALNYTILAHRENPNLGIVRLDITASANSEVVLTDVLEGAGSFRTSYVDSSVELTNNAIWTAVKPIGIRNVTAYEYSSVKFPSSTGVNSTYRNQMLNSTLASTNASTISQQFEIKLTKGETFTVYKYVGIASSDAFPEDTFSVAKKAALNASKAGYEKLLKSHKQAWDEIWETGDIVIPGDDSLQISARASIYHLLANVRQGSEGTGLGDNSISVGGLSSDSYAGFIFWDADTWMFPGLDALFPNYAASIVNYRQKLKSVAVANLKNDSRFKNYNDSLDYPWTSSRFGNCTSTGPCFDYEYHINTDIAQAQWHHFLGSNDTDWLKTEGYPIIEQAANFFTNYLVKNSSTNGTYQSFNLTDPDEYANHINNGAFTNAAVYQLLHWATEASEVLGVKPNSKWLKVADDIYIPENKTLDLTLEYDGMNGSTVIKQADVVMLTYPLQYPQTDSRAIQNLHYYAGKQSDDGPAMTYGIFAVDTAVLSTTGCSTYTYLLYSSQPYLRAPFYQFSEQLNDDPQTNGGTNPAFPFLTGHGGYLQVYTHGLTGYRPAKDALYLDPTLPPQLSEGVTIKGLKFQGGVFDVNITLNETIITRKPDWKFSNKLGVVTNSSSAAKEIAITIGDRNEHAGNYTLKVNETLTISTYRPDLEDPLFEGNIAQCVPVYSDDEWVAGRFPLSINDGDNSTAWQPLSQAKSTILVDLGSEQSFDQAYFLWGNNPPSKVSLGVVVTESTNVSVNVTSLYVNGTTLNANGTAGSTEEESAKWIVNNHSVSISSPYDAKANLTYVTIEPGNDTTITFNQTYTAQYVVVAIEGTHDENSKRGGTLREFVLS